VLSLQSFVRSATSKKTASLGLAVVDADGGDIADDLDLNSDNDGLSDNAEDGLGQAAIPHGTLATLATTATPSRGRTSTCSLARSMPRNEKRGSCRRPPDAGMPPSAPRSGCLKLH
jgi:hypothetical protein